MLITINGVKIEKQPKGYSQAVVAFSRDGKDEERKIMSFGGSANAFNQLVGFTDFPKAVNVKMEKNAKGFWEWKDIEQGNGVAKIETSTQAQTKAVRSNFETPEERARRQVYIVRQSSIANAIAFVTASQAGKAGKVRLEEVLGTAKEFENYVLDVQVPVDGYAEIV